MLTLTTLCAPLPGADAALSKDQRARAIQLLEDSRKELLAAVEGLTNEQWNFKPAPDRWSAREVAEHENRWERAPFSSGLVKQRAQGAGARADRTQGQIHP